jgi:hypothetical protein
MGEGQLREDVGEGEQGDLREHDDSEDEPRPPAPATG